MNIKKGFPIIDIAKRARSPNFTPPEKRILIALVAKYANIVECKKSNAVTNREKAQGWERIQEEFSIQSGHPRPVASLKTCWENLKKMARVHAAKEKQESFSAGVGVTEKPTGALLEDVMTVIRLSLNGLHNPFDNDNEFSETFRTRCSYVEDVAGREDFTSSNDDEAVSQASDRSCSTPSLLKKPHPLIIRTDLMPQSPLFTPNPQEPLPCVSEPVLQCIRQPIPQPTPQAVCKSSPKSFVQITSQPTCQSTSQPSQQPPPQTVSQRSSIPSFQPTIHSTPQPSPQLTTQSPPQPATQSSPQSATLSALQLTTQPSPQPITQPSPQPITQTSPQSAGQSTSQPATQSYSQPTTSSAPRPTPQSVIPSTSQPLTPSSPQPSTSSAPQPSPQSASPSAPQPTTQFSPRPTTQSCSYTNPQSTRPNRRSRRLKRVLTNEVRSLLMARMDVVSLHKKLAVQKALYLQAKREREAALADLQIEGQKLTNTLTELQIEKLKMEMQK